MLKSKIRKYASLFTPSLSGLVIYVFLATVSIILNQFKEVKQYLQLPYELDLLRMIAGWADQLLNNTIGESRTQVLVVGLFWALVGFGVYIFLRGLARIFIDLDDSLEVRHFVWPRGGNREEPLHTLEQQVAFRAAACIIFLIFIFVPLAAVLRGPILTDFLGPNLALQYTVWFAASVLAWHVAVVLLRLIVQRARLFD